MKDIKIGNIYQSKSCGNFIVLEKSEKYNYYKIRFLDTGSISEYRDDAIKLGNVRDGYAKKVCGIACTGNIKTKGKYKVYYEIWHSMICRCYDSKNKRAKSYSNVSVSNDWLVFENFYNSIDKIEGFDDELIRKGELVLDKDIKQRFQKYKIYSIDTCVWISKSKNNEIQDSQQHPFIATSPTGEQYEDFNITRFSSEHQLRRSSISDALRGKIRSVQGWNFRYKEIV